MVDRCVTCRPSLLDRADPKYHEVRWHGAPRADHKLYNSIRLHQALGDRTPRQAYLNPQPGPGRALTPRQPTARVNTSAPAPSPADAVAKVRDATLSFENSDALQLPLFDAEVLEQPPPIAEQDRDQVDLELVE